MSHRTGLHDHNLTRIFPGSAAPGDRLAVPLRRRRKGPVSPPRADGGQQAVHQRRLPGADLRPARAVLPVAGRRRPRQRWPWSVRLTNADPDADKRLVTAPRRRLRKDWDDYFNRFADHYQLADDQRKAAQRQARREPGRRSSQWLTGTTPKTRRLDRTTRFGDHRHGDEDAGSASQEYRDKVEEYRDEQDEVHPRLRRGRVQGEIAADQGRRAPRCAARLLADLDKPLRESL